MGNTWFFCNFIKAYILPLIFAVTAYRVCVAAGAERKLSKSIENYFIMFNKYFKKGIMMEWKEGIPWYERLFVTIIILMPVILFMVIMMLLN